MSAATVTRHDTSALLLLAVATKAVETAAAQGITVAHLSISVGLGVRLHPDRGDLTPALAAALGLTERHVNKWPDRTVEFFDGEIDAAPVTTHWTLPEAGAVA